MSNIAIDATPLSVNGKGVPRFLHQLITELTKYQSSHRFTVFVNELADLPNLPQSSNLAYYPVPVRSDLIWGAIQLPRILQTQKIDLLFTCSDRIPLFYQGLILLYLFELPLPRFRLGRESASLYTRFSTLMTALWFPLSLKNAAHILVSSQATFKAITGSYRNLDNKISLVYPGRTETFNAGDATYDKTLMQKRLGAPNGYVFHISSINDKRDNTSTALRSFHSALPSLPHGIKLVIGGQTDPNRQGLTPIIHELGLENYLIWTGFIQNEDMADVYRSAEVYLDTSLYEGFGYQVIEAMSCGTPVVCSDVTSLPEIVGDAAITAHPNDIQGFANGMIAILCSTEFAIELRNKGLAEVKRFSWPSMVNQLIAKCDKLLSEQH